MEEKRGRASRPPPPPPPTPTRRALASRPADDCARERMTHPHPHARARGERSRRHRLERRDASGVEVFDGPSHPRRRRRRRPRRRRKRRRAVMIDVQPDPRGREQRRRCRYGRRPPPPSADVRGRRGEAVEAATMRGEGFAGDASAATPAARSRASADVRRPHPPDAPRRHAAPQAKSQPEGRRPAATPLPPDRPSVVALVVVVHVGSRGRYRQVEVPQEGGIAPPPGTFVRSDAGRRPRGGGRGARRRSRGRQPRRALGPQPPRGGRRRRTRRIIIIIIAAADAAAADYEKIARREEGAIAPPTPPSRRRGRRRGRGSPPPGVGSGEGAPERIPHVPSEVRPPVQG